MRGIRIWAFVVCWAGLAVLPTDSPAAKDQEKVIPVKVVKASETKFKHAKIVEKKVKKKRFLWFRKKESKVVEPRMATVAVKPVAPSIEQPKAEAAKVIPVPTKQAKAKSSEKATKVEVPEATVPAAESPRD